MSYISITIVHPHRLIAEAIALSLSQVPDLYGVPGIFRPKRTKALPAPVIRGL